MTDNKLDTVTLLQKQKQLLEELLLLLRQELAALASRDIDTLESIANSKNAYLEQLQQNDQTLAAVDNVNELKKEDWFIQAVGEVDSVLDACKRQNNINQKTLEQSQLTLAKFKNEILTSRGKAGLTYTNKGHPAVESKGKGIKA